MENRKENEKNKINADEENKKSNETRSTLLNSNELVKNECVASNSASNASTASNMQDRDNVKLNNQIGGELSEKKSTGNVTCQINLPVPGDAMVKMLRKNEIMKQLKGNLQALIAAPEMESATADDLITPKKTAKGPPPRQLPMVGEVDESIFEPPCLKEMRISEIPYIPLPQYEADPDDKPLGYPCGLENTEKYNESRENERLERKPDPSFIQPDRFVAGVYHSLPYIVVDGEKRKETKQKFPGPYFISTREKFQPETPTVQAKAKVRVSESKIYLQEFVKRVPDMEIRYRKPAAPPTRKLTRPAEVPQPVIKKKEDDSHITIIPNNLVLDAPFKTRKVIYFRIKNDGQCSVATKICTNDNRAVQFTNFCSILHAGDDKLLHVFYTPTSESCSSKAYEPLTIIINYVSLDDLPQEKRKWKSAELKLEFKFQQSKVTEETDVKSAAKKSTCFTEIINPFKRTNVGELSLIYKPLEKTLNDSYLMKSQSLDSESSPEQQPETELRPFKKLKKSNRKKNRVDENTDKSTNPFQMIPLKLVRGIGLLPSEKAQLSTAKSSRLSAKSRSKQKPSEKNSNIIKKDIIKKTDDSIKRSAAKQGQQKTDKSTTQNSDKNSKHKKTAASKKTVPK